MIKIQETVFSKLKNDLQLKIENKSLPSGTPLPSESLLCKKYGISRFSVRKALEELEKAGFIYRKPGKGSFVGQKSSKHKKILNIGVDVDIDFNMPGWYTAKILKGIREICPPAETRVTFVNPDNLESLPDNYIDGLICITINDPQLLAPINEKKIPVVMINRMPSEPELGYISVDYRKEAQKAVEYLLTLGHRRIGIFASNTYTSESRLQGYLDAHQSMGVKVDKSLILFYHSPSHSDILPRLEDYLRINKPTALFSIFAMHMDYIFSTSIKMGLKIPEDLSVLCFDDIDSFSEKTGINFSCIKMPLENMGREAANYLITRIKMGSSIPVIRKVVGADLVIRDSTINCTVK